MQSIDFEPDMYKRWFRRPTVFAALALFLLCAAAKVALPKLTLQVEAFCLYYGLRLDRKALTIGADVVYKLAVLLLPPLVYMKGHPGVDQAMRLKGANPLVLACAAALGAALVPAVDMINVGWQALLRQAGASIPLTRALPADGKAFTMALVIDGALAAVCEGLFYRGFLLGAWERRGAERALAACTIFAAALTAPATELPGVLLICAVLSYCTVASGSLFAGMACHLAFEAAYVLIEYFITARVPNSVLLIPLGGASVMTLGTGAGAMALLPAVAMALFSGLCKRFARWKGLNAAAIEPEALDVPSFIILSVAVMTVLAIWGEALVRLCFAS